MDFSALKKNSGSSSLGQLTAELAKLNTNQETGRDERFWYPDVDKAGNGFASIRFLPAPGDEEERQGLSCPRSGRGPRERDAAERPLDARGRAFFHAAWRPRAAFDDCEPGWHAAGEARPCGAAGAQAWPAAECTRAGFDEGATKEAVVVLCEPRGRDRPVGEAHRATEIGRAHV